MESDFYFIQNMEDLRSVRLSRRLAQVSMQRLVDISTVLYDPTAKGCKSFLSFG
jgi:hypothetical protein